ncbi:histidine kinase [Clostridium sp. Mt-5]|uniref:Histidine kinase n=1 Tax=Clostridium moutaii TaxID=3240932 RepID=A0ABV4BQ49_9CLOT
MNKFNNSLKKLISSKNLYDRYSGILSLSDIPLFLVDTEGDILLEFIPSPDFCTHLCQKKGGHVCSDYMSRIKSGEKGRFICQHGLENVLFPIVVDNETLGYVAGMQVYLQQNEYQKYMIDFKRFKSSKTDELEIIAKSISSLKTVELNKLEVHQRLAGEIAKNVSFDLSDNYFHQNLKRLSIEKEILEKKIIDLEAKNMSLVVNPHFLFNTLNCIARVAYFENSHTTEKLIYCLSDLLRYNLKQDNQLHTIGAEINNIEKYLYIQKVRFKNRLEYHIDVAENIKSYRIPNMVILPIVENSLIHGITPKRDGGKLSIYAEQYNKEIVISIMDNGNGFSKESLLNIRESKNKSGLGLRSTDERLKRYYGEKYGLEIVKSDYSGSTVTITIPAQPVVG